MGIVLWMDLVIIVWLVFQNQNVKVLEVHHIHWDKLYWGLDLGKGLLGGFYMEEELFISSR